MATKKKMTVAQEKKHIMEELKSRGVRLPHGYKVVKRRNKTTKKK